VPRTTLSLEDDAIDTAKAYALRHGVTLGQAVSELVRQGADRQLVVEERSGLKILKLGSRSPKITDALVSHLRNELP
jgi:hypothetical protein